MTSESSKEQNYWPAFVDALSNVVLTLVFVLVVFVFALVLASNKVENKAKEMVREAQEQAQRNDSYETIKTLKQQLEQAQREIEELKAIAVQEEKLTLDETRGLRTTGSGSFLQSESKIVVVFPMAVSDLDAPSQKSLDKLLDTTTAKKPYKKILLHAYIGTETYSAARRLAYYRLIGLRKHLLEREEFKGVIIENKILSPKERQDGRVEIIFDQK